MKIIFHRYGSICEPDLISAFSSVGITVIEEDTEITQKSIEPARRIQLLGDAVMTHQPAFVFSVNYFPYISMLCERLHLLYVCLSVDCPVLELFSATVRNRCNRIFLFDYKQYLRFHPENPEGIFHLPLGVNTDRYDKVLKKAFPSEDAPSYAYDISFIGSLYTEKSPYLSLNLPPAMAGYGDGIINAGQLLSDCSFLETLLSEGALSEEFISALKAADKGFYTLPDSFQNTDAFVASHYYLGMYLSSLKRIHALNSLGERFRVDLFTRSDTTVLNGVICHGGVSTHQEMPLIFCRSKINLNITMKSIETGLPQRIWDVLGCGGFLLTDYQAEIPEFLNIGKDLDCYESIEELNQKAAFYLENGDLRREIARHGYETVKEKHTYLHRILSILKLL